MPRWRKFMMPLRYLIGAVLLLLGILLLMVVFEFRSQRSEVQRLMHEEATLLIRAISLGAENAILAYEEMKEPLSERLLDNLRLPATTSWTANFSPIRSPAAINASHSGRRSKARQRFPGSA